MEIFNAFTAIVNQVGFPIAACCFMGWFVVDERKERQKSFDKQRADFRLMLKEVENSHSVSIESVVKSLNDNTAVLQKISKLLEGK